MGAGDEDIANTEIGTVAAVAVAVGGDEKVCTGEVAEVAEATFIMLPCAFGNDKGVGAETGTVADVVANVDNDVFETIGEEEDSTVVD